MTKGYELPGDNPEADERCRNVERGAKIVTVVPSIYSVVLQMPRGNLETIYPRALVLSGIRQHLDNKDFKSAFLACQNHQVDMNILHDYRPALLMGNASLFVERVKKVKRIDLFLSQLSAGDVSKTLYKDTLARKGPTKIDRANAPDRAKDPATEVEAGEWNKQKVNLICDAFLSVLEGKPQHLQNVITAHVCKTPPALVAALELIASLKERDGKKAEKASLTCASSATSIDSMIQRCRCTISL
jgi:elongator complex protein 1